MTSPAAGSTVGGTITVTADVSTIGSLTVAGVQFKLDGVNLGVEDNTAPYAVPWDTRTATNDTHTLTAVARDALGVLWTSEPVTITVFNDKTPPTVAVTSPSSGAAVRATVAVTASASDNVGVVGVQFRLDGVNLGPEDTTSPYGVSWDTTIASDGSHTLTAVARDAAGNVATSSGITVTVDNSPPLVAIVAPKSGTTVAGTLTATADVSDNLGVAGVQFFLDGAMLGAEDTTSPHEIAWDTTAVAAGSHTLTAVARDAAGNTSTSPGVAVMVSQTATRYENTDLRITYTDGIGAPGQPHGWWHGSRSRGWSGGTSSFNRSENARATFAFTGTTVRWIGFRADWAGIARVFVDDVFVTEIDLYATAEQERAVVFAATGLAPDAPHTLTVEHTGRKNEASSDYAVVVDAFDVAPASPLPAAGARVEETGASLAGAWTAEPAGVRTWSGGSAAVSATAGAQATFTFTGTEVRWTGLRGPQTGIARVFLDGAFHSEVDTFSPVEHQAVVFIAPNLAAGAHTLTIEVTDQTNAASTGHFIVVDAFDVRSRFEEGDLAVAYTADWQENLDRPWSGTTWYRTGSAAISRTAGAQATFTFTGTSVRWIGFRSPWTGLARVLLDGVFQREVDTFAATEEVQVALFSADGLADGPHTLTIEATGQKNPESIDSLILVDAFDVTLSPSALPVTRFQESDPATSYTGDWTHGTRFPIWSGETASFSPAAGAQATFTFTGTAVRWIGQRAFSGGIARVLLDGVQVAEIDTFASLQEEFQAALFATTGLPNTTHTLTIEVTGLKNADAPSTYVITDAFEVQ